MQVCSEEKRVEKLLKKRCSVPVNLFWGSTLYHIDHGSPSLPIMSYGQMLIFITNLVQQAFSSIRNVPDVYTQFRKRMEDVRVFVTPTLSAWLINTLRQEGIIRPLFPTPATLKPLPEELNDKGEVPALSDLLQEAMEEDKEYCYMMN